MAKKSVAKAAAVPLVSAAVAAVLGLALLGLSEWSKVEDKNSITVEEVAKLKNYGFTEKEVQIADRIWKKLSNRRLNRN